MGVRRAVETAVRALSENPGKKVCSLGPLIHNSSVLNSLAEKGLSILDENNIENADENSVVIIRAHGVSPDVQQKLKNRGCQIIDATCPRVVASQKNVRKFSREGYDVFLAGDKNHGEVLGIQGFAEGPFYLLQNKEDADRVAGFDAERSAVPAAGRASGTGAVGVGKPDSEKKAVFLSQTTFSPVEFEKIAASLSEKYGEALKVMNTICPATRERQEALIKLCSQVEAVVVVGGKNSANTKRLLETALKYCENSILIEKASELPESFFEYKKVGITAGASTPDEDINQVYECLSRNL